MEIEAMNNETRILGRIVARELAQKELAAVSGGRMADCGPDTFDTTCDKGDGKWVKDDCRI